MLQRNPFLKIIASNTAQPRLTLPVFLIFNTFFGGFILDDGSRRVKLLTSEKINREPISVKGGIKKVHSRSPRSPRSFMSVATKEKMVT